MPVAIHSLSRKHTARSSPCTRFCGETKYYLNTLRTGDADLRFYITTVQDG